MVAGLVPSLALLPQSGRCAEFEIDVAPNSGVEPHISIDVYLTVSGVSLCAGAQATLNFPSDVLELEGVVRTDLLGAGDSSYAIAPIISSDSLTFAEARVGTNGVADVGAWYLCTFRAKQYGAGTLSVTNAMLSSWRSEPLECPPVNRPIRVHPPPQIDAREPSIGLVELPESTNATFSVVASDPDGDTLTYTWFWDGTNLGTSTSSLVLATDWGDAGAHELVAMVSDGFWTNVWTNWVVTVFSDNDGDGLPNSWERAHGLDPWHDDTTNDPDGDLLTNLEEWQIGCNPTNRDTDGDSLMDGWEVRYGWNPANGEGGLQDIVCAHLGGQYDWDGHASRGLYVRGTHAYVADTVYGEEEPGGLRVYDFSVPSQYYQPVSFFDVTGRCNDVVLDGSFAYLIDTYNKLLRVFRVSDSTNCIPLAAYPAGDYPMEVCLSEDHCYVADLTGGMEVFDVSDPPNCVHLPGYRCGASVWDVCVSRGRAYLVQTDSGTQTGRVLVLDVTDPSRPVLVGRFEMSDDRPVAVSVKGGYAYVALQYAGLRVLDVRNPDNIHTVATFGFDVFDSFVKDVHIDGDVLSVAAEKGLYVFDISSPWNTRLAGSCENIGLAWSQSVFTTGTIACLVGEYHGLQVFTLTPSASAADTDRDNLLDSWETDVWGDLSASAWEDADGDGINNWGEYLAGLNPTNTDTDADGILDGVEINQWITDPSNADTDGDGATDGFEVDMGTDPLDPSDFPALQIVTTALPDGREMVPYTTQLEAVAGTPPYTWTTTNSVLPAGVTVAQSGMVSGTPTSAGTNLVTFVVEDSVGTTVSNTLQLVIDPNPDRPPVVLSNSPPIGAFSLDEGNTQDFTVWAEDPEGGVLSYSWQWNGTSVGAGSNSYSHHAALGSKGTYDLRCYVSDGLWSNVVFSQWDVTVLEVRLEITTDSLPSGMEMVPYAAQLQATNGALPFTWSVAEGYAEDFAANSFASNGVAQGWQADDSTWNLVLPFAFPFFGQEYNQCWVDSNGKIRFDGGGSDYSESVAELINAAMIAVLWGDLRTDSGYDIFVDSGPDSIAIRWYAKYYGDGTPVNVSATLHADGNISLRYGSGNANGGLIGVSAGDGATYLISAQSQSGSMDSTADILFHPAGRLPDGLVLSTNGVLAGTPLLATTSAVTFVVQDSVADTDMRTIDVVIDANPNTRPVISSNAPPAGSLNMPEGTNQTFTIWAHDPEGVALTYSWWLNGGWLDEETSSNLYAETEWGDAGLYQLRCYVSDDLWSNVIFTQWNVTVLDDNDGDGMPNWQELDLGRNPNDPSDGGGPSTLAGIVTGGGIGLSGAYVQLRGAGGTTYHSTLTAPDGTYAFYSVSPGHYYAKAGAEHFADEWYDDATHRTSAVPYTVPADSVIGGFDFDLASGQNPALVEVTSDPSGATVYLDFQATGEVTPVVLNVGEAASHCVCTGARIASHTITVKKPGRPYPPPRPVPAREAETVAMHFDLTADEAGLLSVSTTPEGADVFIDYADAAAGVSPVVVGNFAPGSHVVLLRKPGYLRPRPVVAWVSDQATNTVSVPLDPDSSANRLVAEAQSVPPGATVYVDYLPTTNVTDVVVDWMDAASHSGVGWHSASHTIMLRRPGYLPAAPRYVPEQTNVTHLIVVHLVADVENEVDEDHDGMPDQWEDAYRLRELYPTLNGANDDPDGDGSPNDEERRAGTNPVDGNSVFCIDGMQPQQPGEPFTLVFASVPGKSYMVLCTDDLHLDWVHASGVIVASGYQTVWTTTIPEGEQCLFFQVIVLHP